MSSLDDTPEQFLTGASPLREVRNPRTNVLNTILSFLVLSAMFGCGSSSNSLESDQASTLETKVFKGSYPLKVIATTGMVADLVRQVGGRNVQVTQLLGSGVDPHLYKTTRDDVQAIMAHDFVFYSGLMLEGKMADTLQKIGQRKPVVAVTDGIGGQVHFVSSGSQGHPDPHAWNDVLTWTECMFVVAQSLGEFDPTHAIDYQDAAQAYQQELTALHEYGLKVISSIPPEQRLLVTSHDAFNYFGRAYHLDVLGVQGISTESEAGLQRINELVDILVERKIKAVFVESSVPRKNLEAVVQGARSRGHNVTIGAELFSDAMGEAGTYEGTYIGMLDHNITNVTRALGGVAPAQGMLGRLTLPPKNSSE